MYLSVSYRMDMHHCEFIRLGWLVIWQAHLLLDPNSLVSQYDLMIAACL